MRKLLPGNRTNHLLHAGPTVLDRNRSTKNAMIWKTRELKNCGNRLKPINSIQLRCGQNRGISIKHVEKTWFLMEIFVHFRTATDNRTTQTDRSSMYCSSSKWPLINGPLWGYFLIPERKLATLRDKFSWEDLPAEANLLPKISSF